MIAKRFLDLGMVVIIFLALLKCSSSLKGSKYFMLGQLSTTARPGGDGVNRLWDPTWTDRLKTDLLKSYDKYSRPTEHQNITTVYLSLILLHVSLDYSKSEMALNCWLPMSWQDEKLKWNTSDYNGISRINIPQHEIWLPDILAYNSAHGNIIDYYGQTSTIVKSDGSVLWVPPSRFTVFCTLDLTYWPYDQQTCQLRLGSWSYDGNSIDVQLDKAKSSIEDLEVSEWKVIDVSQKRFVQYYHHCPEPYVEIIFSYTVKKESPAFFYTIIFPAIVTMMLTMSAFWLPPESMERFILNGICAVIAVLFLIYFSIKLPIMVHTPLIVVFYSTVLGLMGVSLGIFIAMDNLRKQESHPKPISRLLSSIADFRLGQNFLRPSPYSTLLNSDERSKFGGIRTPNGSATGMPSMISNENLIGKKGKPQPYPLSADQTFLKPSSNEWRSLATLFHKISLVAHVLMYLIILIKCFY
nr:PREDICTED: acetylcholine receptor subunit alpha-like 1 [Bemisia tabaci]